MSYIQKNTGNKVLLTGVNTLKILLSTLELLYLTLALGVSRFHFYSSNWSWIHYKSINFSMYWCLSDLWRKELLYCFYAFFKRWHFRCYQNSRRGRTRVKMARSSSILTPHTIYAEHKFLTLVRMFAATTHLLFRNMKASGKRTFQIFCATVIQVTDSSLLNR